RGGSPVPLRKGEDLPGRWVVLFMRAADQLPRLGRRPLTHERERRYCLQGETSLGPSEYCPFRGRTAAAHMLACLRIDGPVTEVAARLATDWSGLTFVGRVSHPLDGCFDFPIVPHLSSCQNQPCLVARLAGLSWPRRIPRADSIRKN